MSQEPSVLLVDLPDQGAGFARALHQVGRPSVFITKDQLGVAFEHGRPLGVVALSTDVPQVAAVIREQEYPNQLPLFVLQPDTPGSIRPPLPEVTAVVSSGIEPGILALRMQTALQQVGGPRPRQATVLGMGSLSKPQPLPSQAPSQPPKSGPISEAPAPQLSTSVRPPLPSEVPWNTTEPGVVSSAPPVISDSKPKASSSPLKQAVVSSAPPLPEIGTPAPAALNIPDAAPLPKEIAALPSGSPTAPVPPVSSAIDRGDSSPAETIPTHPPVALSQGAAAPSSSVEFDADEMRLGKKSWLPRAAVAAVIVAALGGGALLMKGTPSETQEASAKTREETVTPKPAETSTTQASSASQAAEKVVKEVPEPTAGEASAGEEPKEETAPAGESAYFKIQSPVQLDSCEKTLGKSPADFASAKKWRAAQSWKLARKSLMAGKESDALKHMCEASFIDASGPATVGLAKYYLGKRALDEAHVWAQKAVDAASGASSKRTAQQVLGDVLSQMGKVDEARAIWLESFNLTADQTSRLAPVVRNFIGAAVKARKGGDPSLAEQLLRRATTFEPDNVNASALLAATLLENGEKGLAKLWADRALSKKPGLDMAEEVLKTLGG